MPGTPELSEARRALLEKYLRGDILQTATATGIVTQGAKAEAVDQRERVVAIQISGSKRPFFFLHGDYKGGAFYCFPLAHNLGSDQPFYALEPYKFDGLRVPPTLETIASAHIKSLRAVQQEGPYLLGGFCNGGLVAYEMARQLHAEGQTVDLLILMDPYPIAYMGLICGVVNRIGGLMRLGRDKQLDCFLWLRHMYRYLQHVYRYLRFPHYRGLKTELDPERVKPNGGTILTLKALHEQRLSQGTEHLGTDGQNEPGCRRDKVSFALPRLDSIFPDAIFPPSEALRKDYPGVFYWATSDYVPDFYPGKSTFFFFRDSQGGHRRRVHWRKVAEAKDKETEVHVLAGTHDTCKTKYLHDLTECLHTCLSKVQASNQR